MKIKGISFWEQHLERFVLGLAGLACVGLIAMQFIGEPNAATVDGKTISPGEVDQLLVDRAEELANKFRHDSGPDQAAPEPILETFMSKLKGSISPASELWVSHPALGPGIGIVAPPADKPFRVAEVPPPFDLVSQQYFDTLTPEVVADFEQLKQRLPNAPHDISWITIAASFDEASVRKQFVERGPNGELELPLRWHNERVDYIDLRVEREELVDGHWTNLTVLDPIPGQFNFRDNLSKPIDSATRNTILAAAADPNTRTQLIRPEFYEGKAGAWTPPDAETIQKIDPNESLTDEQLQIRDLQTRLAKLERAKAKLVQELRDNNCPEKPQNDDDDKDKDKPRDRDRGGRSGGGGGRSAPGGGGGEMAGGGGKRLETPGGSQSNKAVCDRLHQRLKVLNNKIASVTAELEKLQAKPVEPPPSDTQIKPQDEPKDIINVWAHDITIQPGKTYRYRMVMHIYNPLFARKLDLIPEQQSLAEQFTLASVPSEWSAPIHAEPPLRVFVTKAKAVMPGLLGGTAAGQATAEIYRFRDGRWWMEDFVVQPGDRIGRTVTDRKSNTTIEYGTDWFVLDIIEILGAPANDDRAAIVLLHSLNGETVQRRDPRRDYLDPQRRDLNQEVKLAGDDQSVALAR